MKQVLVKNRTRFIILIDFISDYKQQQSLFVFILKQWLLLLNHIHASYKLYLSYYKHQVTKLPSLQQKHCSLIYRVRSVYIFVPNYKNALPNIRWVFETGGYNYVFFTAETCRTCHLFSPAFLFHSLFQRWLQMICDCVFSSAMPLSSGLLAIGSILIQSSYHVLESRKSD